MTVSSRRSAILSSVLSGACGLIIMHGGNAAQAAEIADAITALSQQTEIRERVSLKALGLTEPVVLGSSDARRDIYLPVPANIELSEPRLVVDGRYLRADGGQTTYTLAVDGTVVAAQSPTAPQGDVEISVDVEGAPRPSGFVRMGLAWSSATGRFLCDDARPIGNMLQISPDSHLEYSYDAGDVKTIADAWSALPQRVVLLVSRDELTSESFDAAWRLGVTLERAGKTVDVAALPTIGSEFDVSGLEIPPALKRVPAFAALAGGGVITLSSDAEIGALILLDAPQLHAHIAVADQMLAGGLTTALKAVAEELERADAAAVDAIDTLVVRKNALAMASEPKSIEIATLTGRPVIAVAPDAARAASGLLDGFWRRTASTDHLVLDTAARPDTDTDSIALASLNQAAGNLDVVARGDWTTSFNLGTSLPEGKVPASMDVYVAAAPGATATAPVASIFINDYLLGAKRLTADGKAEKISVGIPSYALLPRNTMQVRIQRQPASDECRETPQPFPAAVLPESRVFLKSAPKLGNFAEMTARLAGDASLFVPTNWRLDATRSLPTIIQLADTVGVSPSRATLSFEEGDAEIEPKTPYLAFDTPVKGARDTVKVSGDRVSIADAKGKTFYDVSGLERVAVVQAVSGSKEPGVSYQSVGTPPVFETPFQLAGGDIAVLGEDGVLAAVNSRGAPLYLNEDGSQRGDAPFTWERLLDPAFWMHNLSLLVAGVLAFAFFLLIFFARRAKKRQSADQG